MLCPLYVPMRYPHFASVIMLIIGAAHAQTAPPATATGPAPEPQVAKASEPRPMPRLDTLDWVVSGLAVGASVAMQLAGPLDTPRWTSRNDLDDGSRSFFRATSVDGIGRVTTASNLVLGAGVASSAAMAVLGRGDFSEGIVLFGVQLEAVAMTLMVTQVAKRDFGRTRPLYADGKKEASSDANASFWSGHAAIGFASAASTCTLQHKGALFDAALTPWICGTLFGAAGAVGVLRMVADQHYLTDVVTGAAIGTIIGYGITGLRAWSDDPVLRLTPVATPTSASLFLDYRF